MSSQHHVYRKATAMVVRALNALGRGEVLRIDGVVRRRANFRPLLETDPSRSRP